MKTDSEGSKRCVIPDLFRCIYRSFTNNGFSVFQLLLGEYNANNTAYTNRDQPNVISSILGVLIYLQQLNYIPYAHSAFIHTVLH